MALSTEEWLGDSKENKDIGVTQSILAGIGSGIFKIFEGGATLGATLLDLGIDKNRAEAVEAFFDDINPFDEVAAVSYTHLTLPTKRIV